MLSEFQTPWERKTWTTIVYAVVIAALTLLALFGILNTILVYWPITLFVILVLLHQLAHTAGTLLMFPGSFKYYRGSIEKNYSREMTKKIKAALKNLGDIHMYLQTGITQPEKSLILSQHTLEYFAGILHKFFDKKTLSKNKTKLLSNINGILEAYRSEDYGKDSIKWFMTRRHSLVCQRKPGVSSSLRLAQLVKECELLLEIFSDPVVGAVKNFYYQSYNEKLYQIRFGVLLFDNKFYYQNHQVVDGNINLFIIKGFKEEIPLQTSRLVLICNPNGAFIEQFAFQTGYVNFYLQEGYNVCLWNYRGYSESKGNPSLVQNKADVLQIYDFLKSQGYQLEIAHGYSIGGPTSIYLASKRKLSLVIADRTFSSLVQMSRRFGKVATFIFKLAFRNDLTDYSELFLNLECRKLIIYDPSDEIVDNLSSLKTGVARLTFNILDKETSLNTHLQTDQATNMQLNGQIALKKLLSSDQQASQTVFPKGFYNSLLWNSIPFMYEDLNSNGSQRSQRRRTKCVETSVDTAMQTISTDLSRQALVTECEQLAKPKLAKKEVFQTIGQIPYVDSVTMNIPTVQLCRFKNIVDKSDALEQMRSYVQGLIVYGSYPERQHHYIDPLSVKDQTILKLYQMCEELKYMEQNALPLFPDQAHFLKTLRQQFGKIASVIYSNFNNPLFLRAGMILPVDTGHNGEFRYQQWGILSEIIRQNPSPDVIPDIGV